LTGLGCVDAFFAAGDIGIGDDLIENIHGDLLIRQHLFHLRADSRIDNALIGDQERPLGLEVSGLLAHFIQRAKTGENEVR